MILRYFSDLHLEFIKPHKMGQFLKRIPLPTSNEVCILAGDIGNPQHSSNNYDVFMKYISSHFTKTFVIPGNHEYYHKTKTIEETDEFLKEYFQKFENISFLNNTCEQYNNHCFIGTVLWSKITNPAYEINDVYNIPNYDYIKYNRLNRMCVDFLEDAIEHNNNCVVITHHMPSQSLIDVKYKVPSMIKYNQWFYCDMDKLMEEKHDKISCWIYGHTHTPLQTINHGVRMYCNPIGYPNENAKTDFGKQIDLTV